MKLNRKELCDALGLLTPGLSSRDILEDGLCFNFHGDMIVASNESLCVSLPFQIGFTGSVRASELYLLLNKINSEEVEINREGNEVKIKAGKIKAGLIVRDEILSPVYPESDWQELPGDFIEALKFCQFSISKDMTRPHLTCIHLQEKRVTSTDSWRITQFVMRQKIPSDFLLPGNAAVPLVKYQGITHMSLDSNWVHFANAETGLIFSANLKSSKFIEVDKYFEIEGTIVNLPNLNETLDRCTIMVEAASKIDEKIYMDFKPGELVIRAKKEIGWLEELKEIDYEGPPLKIIANPSFLKDITSRLSQAMVNEQFCMIWGENFRHIMMLSDE